MVNEYGHEPSEKHWYYERQKQEQEKQQSQLVSLSITSEQEQKSTVVLVAANNNNTTEETEIEIIPNSIQTLEQLIYVPAKRPSLNKQCTEQAPVITTGSEETPKAESESKVTNSNIGSSSLDGNNTIAKVESIDSHTSETDAVNDTPNRIDYESIYRSRVERLLYQGRIAEITSFEEWKRSVESLL